MEDGQIRRRSGRRQAAGAGAPVMRLRCALQGRRIAGSLGSPVASMENQAASIGLLAGYSHRLD